MTDSKPLFSMRNSSFSHFVTKKEPSRPPCILRLVRCHSRRTDCFTIESASRMRSRRWFTSSMILLRATLSSTSASTKSPRMIAPTRWPIGSNGSPPSGTSRIASPKDSASAESFERRRAPSCSSFQSHLSRGRPRPEGKILQRLRSAVFSEAEDIDTRTAVLLSLASSTACFPPSSTPRT